MYDRTLGRKPSFFYNLGFLVVGIIAASSWNGAHAVKSCSSYQLSCSLAGPGGSCTYYIFIPGETSQEIKQLPYDLSKLIPKETYCDLEAESQLKETLKKIPYQLGSVNINRLPMVVNLKYKIVRRETAGHGGAYSSITYNGGQTSGRDYATAYDVNGDGYADYNSAQQAKEAGYVGGSYVSYETGSMNSIKLDTKIGRSKIDTTDKHVARNNVGLGGADRSQEEQAEDQLKEDNEEETEEAKKKEDDDDDDGSSFGGGGSSGGSGHHP